VRATNEAADIMANAPDEERPFSLGLPKRRQEESKDTELVALFEPDVIDAKTLVT
jgi:hypothetical protein